MARRFASTKAASTKDDDELPPEEAQRRMDEAVKRPLSHKPETHDQMVKRKHRKGEIKPRPRKKV